MQKLIICINLSLLFLNLVLVVLMVTTMTRSVASNLIIDPPGPVAVFDLSISSLHSKQIAITCTSTGNVNITWEIPTFNFAELNKQSVSVYI